MLVLIYNIRLMSYHVHVQALSLLGPPTEYISGLQCVADHGWVEVGGGGIPVSH